MLLFSILHHTPRSNQSFCYKLIVQAKYFSNLSFVPNCESVNIEDIRLLKQFLHNTRKICAITGAGISTESGIPDYRSERVGLFATSDRRPMAYQEFCKSAHSRKRYWARNYAEFQPNLTHKWLKKLEDQEKINCVITQNVDSLHLKAGSKNVIELHGTAFRVMCLNCDNKIDRYKFQEILNNLNPNMVTFCESIRPDGDVDLSEDQIADFKIPPCNKCGGVLKPDIVFFGDNVAKNIVEQVQNEVDEADGLIVLGSSLTTFSGYRIVLQAAEACKPVAIVNIGKTRGDEHAQIKVKGRCGEVIEKLESL